MNKGFMKKILCMFSLISIVCGLVGCTHNNTAYGDLTDNVYFSEGDFQLTEKQLYDLMLTNKNSTFTFVSEISELVNQKVLKAYLDEVEANWSVIVDETLEETYKEKAKNEIEKSVYGTDEDEEIANLPSSTKETQVKQFLDSQVLKGIIADDIYDEQILNTYKYQFAKERFAKKILEVEVTYEFVKDEDGEDTEEENANYISEEDIDAYYDSNYKGKNDFAVIDIAFTNLNEVEEYYRNYEYTDGTNSFKGLKSYKDELYLVPTTVNYDTIINSDNVSNYTKFSSINDGKDLLIMFVELYVELYGYSTDIDASDIATLKTKTFEEVVTLLSTDETYSDFQKEYEDYSYSNSTLSNYVATSLKVKNEEFTKALPRFTSTPKSLNNTYYLIYKLDDGEDKELTDELRAEIREELIDAKLTSSYISTKIAELEAEYSYTIYDGNIQNVYKAMNDDLKTTRKSHETLLLSVEVAANEDLFINATTVELTVRELYNELEKSIGMNTALNAAYRYELSKLTNYDDEFDKDTLADYKDDIKTVISDFKNGSYASIGLPKSVGQTTFLKLYFGVNKKSELLDSYYVINKKSELFLKDMELNFKQNNDSYYDTIAEYTKNYYNDYFSANVGHVLVYTDINLDGTPDNPEIYTAEEKEQYETIALELQQYFYNTAKKLTGKLNTSLQYLANEFTKANKFNETVYNETGNTFGELKKLGIYAKYESLGSISVSNYTSYDQAFINKVLDIIALATEEGQDFDNEQEYLGKLTSINDLAVSSFGYHLIVISNVNDKDDLDAKYTSSDDTGSSYDEILYDGNDEPINAYSDEVYLSANQIEIYMREKDLSSGIKNLPTKVKTACSTLVSPILTKYNSSYNQFFLKLSLLKNADFTEVKNDNLLNEYKAYQATLFFGYNLKDATVNPFENWFLDNYNYDYTGGNN